ncbi:MAG: PfkB family carbohydrate kinase [Planctomycetaceae bacterium]|nr:PfkB family carbohydrate kinase [Planctomycetaceae bacterium]
MILCAGLSPAWQQVLVFDRFRYGEVNRAAESHWFAQGKVLNAGVAAHSLGGPSKTLAVVGGPPRESIEREFSALGVPHRWVVTESATRVCTTILDRTTGRMTELVENARPIRPEELDEFRRAYVEEAAEARVVVLTGSLPAGVPESFYRELVAATTCPMVLDFRGVGLLGCLDLHPRVVKPNREELSQTVGRPLTDDAALLDAMRDLNRRGARWVVVTQGAGPVWVTSESETYRLTSPSVGRVVNPLGSGDCLAAGMAWAIAGGRTMLEAVRIGVAAALENLAQLEIGRLDSVRVLRQADRVRVEPWGSTCTR